MFDNKNVIYVDIENYEDWIEMMTVLEDKGYKWDNCQSCNKMQGVAFSPLSKDINYNESLYNIITISPNSNLITRITRKYCQSQKRGHILSFDEFSEKFLLNLDWAREIINSD